MSELRQRIIEELQLLGLAEKNQQAYIRAVQQLAQSTGSLPTASVKPSYGNTFSTSRMRNR